MGTSEAGLILEFTENPTLQARRRITAELAVVREDRET